MIPQTFCTEL